MGKAMLTIMSAFAQLERETLAERTKAGMAVSGANGRKAGRLEVAADDENVAKAKAYDAKCNSVDEIQKLIGASRGTVYRYLRMRGDSSRS
jgi:DNA invertase Pin-like site-specific DNA recombinase